MRIKPPAISFLLAAKARQPKGEPFSIMPLAIEKIAREVSTMICLTLLV